MTRALCLAFLVALAPAALGQSDRAAEELRAEMVFWESIRASSDPADFHAYLEQYPNGKFAALARNRLNALGSPKPAAAAVPSPAPPAAAASTWTYRLLDAKRQVRGQHEARLVSATGGVFVEEYFAAGGAPTRIEHRRGDYIYPAGEITLFSPYALNFGAPVMGRVENLDPRTCKGGWSCSVRGRIAGRERVRVPAGEFEAVRIEITQEWVSPSQTHDRGERVLRTITVWYAEDVKRAVKAIGRGTPSAWVDTEFELELVSYQLR